MTGVLENKQVGSDLWQARYGQEASTDPSLLDHTVLRTLLNHRSVRAYKPDPLPEGTLERLLAAAQSASTSSNLQTWSVVAVEDPERKARLAALGANQPQIKECPLLLMWLADLARLRQVAASRQSPAEGLDYLEMFLMAAVDAALAAQNAMIAAESLGLGSVYLGVMRNRPREVAAELNLPPGVVTVFGMCVGYPDPERATPIKPRLPQPAVLHREQYQLEGQMDHINTYNQIMVEFYEQQGMAVQEDWSDHSIKRIRSAESLMGRDQLYGILQELGFPLQ